MPVLQKNLYFLGTDLGPFAVSMSMNAIAKNPPGTGQPADLKLKDLASKWYLLRDEADLDPGVFPQMYSLSAKFLYRFLPTDITPSDPEYVFVKRPEEYGLTGVERCLYDQFLVMWNHMWEGSPRRPLDIKIPDQFRWVTKSAVNLRLVCRAANH